MMNEYFGANSNADKYKIYDNYLYTAFINSVPNNVMVTKVKKILVRHHAPSVDLKSVSQSNSSQWDTKRPLILFDFSEARMYNEIPLFGS